MDHTYRSTSQISDSQPSEPLKLTGSVENLRLSGDNLALSYQMKAMS